MLLHPGAAYDYDGQRRRYPDVKLVYWSGGNPFHHHQDLARLREAFARPQTVVVHDPFWTATARHADIVLPSTMSVERDDLGVGGADSTCSPCRSWPNRMHRPRRLRHLRRPRGPAAGGKAFAEGRTAGQWLRHLYRQWRSGMQAAGHEMPPFEQFWAAGSLEIPVPDPDQVLLSAFRRTRQASLSARRAGRSRSSRRPSIASAMPTAPDIRSGFWPGRMARPPPEWLSPPAGGQPAPPSYSPPSQLRRRRLQPGRQDPRGGGDRDESGRRGRPGNRRRLVRPIFNDRGSCLAGVTLTEDVGPGVVQLSTGAWSDPDPPTRPSAATATRTCSPPAGPAPPSPRVRLASSPWSRSNPTMRCRRSVHRPPVTAEPTRRSR